MISYNISIFATHNKWNIKSSYEQNPLVFFLKSHSFNDRWMYKHRLAMPYRKTKRLHFLCFLSYVNWSHCSRWAKGHQLHVIWSMCSILLFVSTLENYFCQNFDHWINFFGKQRQWAIKWYFMLRFKLNIFYKTSRENNQPYHYPL